jgi:hypothetical protein
LTGAWSRTDAARKVARGHVRLGAVVPIGVIVVFAIICVVVAVFSAAHHADETAGVALAGFVLLAARFVDGRIPNAAKFRPQNSFPLRKTVD